jgi:plasmid stabilization system protein ParE
MAYELHAEVPGLGSRFVSEIERCLRLLVDAPKIGTPYGRRLRRFVIDDGFPFSVIHAEVRGILFVISIAHHSRRPGYWRRRAIR